MRFESSFLGCEDNTDPKFKSGEINEMTPNPPGTPPEPPRNMGICCFLTLIRNTNPPGTPPE